MVSSRTRASAVVWTKRDHEVLAGVEEALAYGLALKEWWQRIDEESSYAQSFHVTRSFNTPDSSFGFFDETIVDGRGVPVMGLVEDAHYDYVKSDVRRAGEELCEFVLKYFLRVTDFRQPQTYLESASRPWGIRTPGLSWCADDDVRRGGFGYSQHYFKRRDPSEIGRFISDEAFAIVDLRTLGEVFDWIVVKVRLFDFNVDVQPLGAHAPRVVVPLSEESYLVLSRDFIVDALEPEPGVIRKCGFGYAFIRDPSAPGLIAYGPGRFKMAFKFIQFRLLKSGEIRVQMVFVANRPENILKVSLDPVRWSLRALDVLTLGLVSRMVGSTDDCAPFVDVPFDPLTAYIEAANVLTRGVAAEALCISKVTLEKYFLLRHFQQHYEMLSGSLLTWRGIADWRDAEVLPNWVRTGVSS